MKRHVRLTKTDRVDELHAMIMKSLDDDQAVDPVSIPLAGKTSIADFMVIASGRSGRQVASMAVKIADKMKADFRRTARVQGLPAAVEVPQLPAPEAADAAQEKPEAGTDAVTSG